MKLSISLYAPHIIIPYKGVTNSGTLHVLLGDFTLTNRLVHGYDIMDSRASVMSINASQVILDRMEIQCTCLCVFRESISLDVVKGMAIRNDIMDSLNFTAVVTRNLTPTTSSTFPDVNVSLEIENEIQVSIHVYVYIYR